LQFGGRLAGLLQQNDEKNATAEYQKEFHPAPPGLSDHATGSMGAGE
jgi:hypothetical protein